MRRRGGAATTGPGAPIRWARALLAAALAPAAAAVALHQGGVEDFERMPLGVFSRVESPLFTLEGPARGLVLVDRARRGEDGGRALRLKGGDGPVELRIALPAPATARQTLRVRARRLARQGRFEATLAAEAGDVRASASIGDWLPADEFAYVELGLPEGASEARLTLDCEGAVGLLLDDLELADARPMELTRVELARRGLPVLRGSRAPVPLGSLQLVTEGTLDPLALEAVEIRLDGDLELTSATARLRGDDAPFERTDGGWWRLERGGALGGAPLRLELAGTVARGAAPDAPAEHGALARDAVGRLAARVRIRGAAEPVDAVPRTWTRSLCTAARVVDGRAHTIDAVAAAPHVPTGSEAWVVAAVALRGADGRPFVRILRWSAHGERTERDLAPEDAALGYVRPVLVLDRLGGAGLVALERVSWRDGDAAGDLVVLGTDDGGATFGDAAALDVIDDDDAARIGGHLRLQPGRGVVEGTTWALPILRSHGHPRCAAALLVSTDGGATWAVSTGVHAGARGASAVALGEKAILVEAWAEPRLPRAEQSTLNAGVWWVGLSDASPPRPASPEGVAWVHVGRETGWGPDGRLLYACAPADAPHGLVLRGTNDYGAIWHEHRRAMLDDREGAGAPGLALADADRIVVLFRSGDGDLLLQVRDLAPFAGPLQSLEGLFGPR